MWLTNSSIQQCYEWVVLCTDISLQRGRFCTRSLALRIPRSSEERSSWTFFIQIVCGRPGGRLQFSGGASKMARLASAFSSICARCPKESETMGLSDGWKWWLVSNATDVGISDKVVPTKMSTILRKQHWPTASVRGLRIQKTEIYQLFFSKLVHYVVSQSQYQRWCKDKSVIESRSAHIKRHQNTYLAQYTGWAKTDSWP